MRRDGEVREVLPVAKRGRGGSRPGERARQNPDGSVVKKTTRETGPSAWQASAWLLERKFPGEFGRRVVEPGGEMKGSAAALAIIKINFGDEDEEGDEEGKARRTNGTVGRKTRLTPDDRRSWRILADSSSPRCAGSEVTRQKPGVEKRGCRKGLSSGR